MGVQHCHSFGGGRRRGPRGRRRARPPREGGARGAVWSPHREIAALPNTLILSAGTDGTDGRTDAAGAVADGTTVERARSLGLDPLDALARDDAEPFCGRV